MQQKVSNYRWVMLALALLFTIVGCAMNLLPSSLTTAIMTDTGWDAGQTGALISIISLLIGIFVFVGSPLMDKLGVKTTAIIALAIMTIGGIIPFFAGTDYTLHYIGRLLFGLGYGMGLNIPPVLITIWFPQQEQPTMQGIRAAFNFLGFALAFYIILPIFNANGSWQITSGIIGVAVGVVLLLFVFLARNPKLTGSPSDHDPLPHVEETPKIKEQSGLAQAAKRKEVWMLWLGLLGLQWVFGTYNTYLPTYLELERGFSAVDASALTGIMPIAGLIAGVACGALASILGRRKLFGWPLLLLMGIGVLLTLFTDGFLCAAGIALVGFSAGGYTLMYSTVPADLPGSNPALYGGAMAIIIGFAYIPTFFLPNITQAMLNAGMTYGTVLLIFDIFAVVGMIPLILIKETGPKGKGYKTAALKKE